MSVLRFIVSVVLLLAAQARAQPNLLSAVAVDMARISKHFAGIDSLEELHQTRKAIRESGYLLVTTEMGYIGGNGVRQYFALFSELKGAERPVLVGWAMLPEWVVLPQRHQFRVAGEKDGQGRLKMMFIDDGGERPRHGKPLVHYYRIPGRREWGRELALDN